MTVMPCNIGNSILNKQKINSERKTKKKLTKKSHIDSILHGFDTIQDQFYVTDFHVDPNLQQIQY